MTQLVAALLVGAGPVGVAADIINVSLLGTATQSSQLGGYSPDLAIDGNLGSFTHTQSGANLPAIWELDLKQSYAIQKIVLHNRVDCCSSRLRDITVSILDETAQPLWQSDLLNPENELGAFPTGPAELSLDLVVTEGSPVDGRFVRVTREPDPDLSGGGDGTNPDENDVLSLAEVEVFADSSSVPVAILQQPRGGRTYVGRCHTFTVTLFGAENATTIAYQWLKDDLPVRDATEDRLILGPLEAEDSGTYKVRITADAAVLESDPAQLVVVGPNLALHGFATQSSTGWNGPAGLAIDGNVSGIYDQGSVTHTQDEPGAWWTVELFGDSEVDRVILWNRMDDCCRMRLTSFKVSALDSGGTVAWEDEFFPDLDYPEESFEIELDGTICRTIRIDRLAPDINGNTILSLAEVEVFGDGPFPPLDLARSCGATTQQSSTANPYLPSLAVDGNLATFTHTIAGNEGLGPAWWELDLQQEQDIGEIVLRNRVDCCSSRLRDITVSILDGAGGVAWASDLFNPENELGVFPLGPEAIVVDVEQLAGRAIRGRIVRVEREPDPDLSGGGDGTNLDEVDVLSLAEVEVHPPEGAPGAPRFVRGDSDANGNVNITDGIYVLNFLFLGGPTPTCADSSDTDGNGSVNITDGIYILNFLFLGGPAPPEPYPGCGVDPDEDAGVDCAASHPGCSGGP